MPSRTRVARRRGTGFCAALASAWRESSKAVRIPKPPWEERKRVYIAGIGEKSASVRLVSAADKLHNARCILSDYRHLGEEIWRRFVGRREGTLWYYRSVVDALVRSGRTPLVDELDRVVGEIERLAHSNLNSARIPAAGSITRNRMHT